MGTLFYLKVMDGKETVLKQEQTFDHQAIKVDFFLSAHGVEIWHTDLVSKSPAPWSDSTNWVTTREWRLYRSVKSIWMLKSEYQVPKILRMMALTGAV